MWRRISAAVLVFVIATASASGAEWTVLRSAGDVTVSDDGRTWSRVTAGTTVPNPSWVRTGRSGRVILARDRERISYGPNSLASVSTSEPTGQKTRVRQRRGQLVLDIETRRRRETTVITPHLAAVVKGTRFEVNVGAASSAVRVDEGAVDVSASGDTVQVAAGQVATSSGSGIDVAATPATSNAWARISDYPSGCSRWMTPKL